MAAINDVRARIAADARALDRQAIMLWHEITFRTTFPRDAGRLRWKLPNGRWEDVFFGVNVGTSNTRRIRQHKGAHPNRISTHLDGICEQFNAFLAETTAAGLGTLHSSSVAAARVYARVLNVHPFADGNLRAAFVALQFCLQALAHPMVEFPSVPDHDEALDTALRIDHRAARSDRSLAGRTPRASR